MGALFVLMVLLGHPLAAVQSTRFQISLGNSSLDSEDVQRWSNEKGGFAKAPDSEQETAALAHSYDLGWMNTLVARMWPHIDKAMWKIIDGSMNPVLTAKLPHAFSGLQIRQFTLGELAPVFGPMRIVNQPDGVKLVVHIDYASGSNIIIATESGKVSFGLENLRFRGDLVLQLKPLIDEVPVIGGCKGYFIDPPIIDMNFAGMAVIAQAPLLESIVRKAINAAVADKAVLPNAIGVPFATEEQGVRMTTFTQPELAGVLRATPQRAEGLRNVEWFGKSDPYVHIQIGQQQWSSSYIKSSQDPTWNGDTHDFPVHDRGQKILISLWDHDRTWDKKMAVASPLTVNQAIQSSQETLQLYKNESGSTGLAESGGELFVTFEWLILVPFEHNHHAGMLEITTFHLTFPRAVNVAALKVKFGDVTKVTPLGQKPKLPPWKVKALTPVVSNCKKESIPREKIARITGLTEQQVEELSGAEPDEAALPAHVQLDLHSILYFPIDQATTDITATFSFVDAKEHVLGETRMEMASIWDKLVNQDSPQGTVRAGQMAASVKLSVYGLIPDPDEVVAG